MKYHFFIGIDRSDSSLDYCSLDQDGCSIKQAKIRSAPEELLPWIQDLEKKLPPGKLIALCIEQPCQNLVHFFSRFDFR